MSTRNLLQNGFEWSNERISLIIRENRDRKHGLILLLLPSLMLILSLMIVPTIVLVDFSFKPFEAGNIVDGFTLAHFERALLSDLHQNTAMRTVRIAAAVTVIDFLLGYPLAYAAVRRGGTLGKVIVLSTLLPLTIDLVIRSFGWYVLLQSGGVIPSALVTSGLFTTESVPDLLFNETSIVIGLAHVHLPFMVFPLISVLHTIPKSLEDAARDLGANRFTVFYRVLFPLSLPGITAGVLITFVISMAAYVTPTMLGGGVKVLPIVITNNFVSTHNWPFGSALAMELVVLGLIAIVGYYRVLKSVETEGGI